MHMLLLGLQGFHVFVLLLHDLAPLGRFNNIRGIRAGRSIPKQTVRSVLFVIPFAVLMLYSYMYLHRPYPPVLVVSLWVVYALLFYLEWRSVWRPYFFGPTYEQVDEYRRLYSGTHSFLPRRKGMRPNTMHLVLHGATVLMLLALAAGALGNRVL